MWSYQQRWRNVYADGTFLDGGGELWRKAQPPLCSTVRCARAPPAPQRADGTVHMLVGVCCWEASTIQHCSNWHARLRFVWKKKLKKKCYPLLSGDTGSDTRAGLFSATYSALFQVGPDFCLIVFLLVCSIFTQKFCDCQAKKKVPRASSPSNELAQLANVLKVSFSWSFDLFIVLLSSKCGMGMLKLG